MKTIHAVYERGVFRPREAVELPERTEVEFEPRPVVQLEGANVLRDSVKPLTSRGELARQLMGAGRRWLKPGADPVADLIREREEDDRLDQADERP